jgi:hypothetical protein
LNLYNYIEHTLGWLVSRTSQPKRKVHSNME